MDTAEIVNLIGAVSGLIVSLGVTYLIVRISVVVGKFSID
jgi:hypothetical protein